MKEEGSDEHSRTYLQKLILPFRSQSNDPECLFNGRYTLSLVKLKEPFLQFMSNQHTLEALVSGENLIFQWVQGFLACDVCIPIATQWLFSSQANTDDGSEIPQTPEIVFFWYFSTPLMWSKIQCLAVGWLNTQPQKKLCTMAHDAWDDTSTWAEKASKLSNKVATCANYNRCKDVWSRALTTPKFSYEQPISTGN